MPAHHMTAVHAVTTTGKPFSSISGLQLGAHNDPLAAVQALATCTQHICAGGFD